MQIQPVNQITLLYGATLVNSILSASPTYFMALPFLSCLIGKINYMRSWSVQRGFADGKGYHLFKWRRVCTM